MTENSRVLLYQPRIDFRPYYPCFWAPLSLLSIAAPLVDKGYKVEIIDGNLEGSNDSNQGVPPNLDGVLFVGISAMIGGNQIVSAMNFAKDVKVINPDVPVIIGGPAATVIPKQLIECEYFDAVVRGQGELPITMIAEALSNDASISGITGVVTRDHLDVQIPPLQDKSIFPPYPWELVDVSAYLRNDPYTGGRTLNYVSSQGCPYKCGYCSESFTCNSKWTGLSAERIFAEVSDLVKANNLTGIKFYDSNFFANIRRTRRFAELIIESGLQVNWSASAHPKDLIRIANDMPLLKKSGLSRLLIGAESGYQPVLDYVQKGTQVEDNLTVARICAKNQVAVSFTYIVGFPGIEGDIEPTLHQAIELKEISPEFDVNIHFYYPFPGSNLYDRALEHGYHAPETLEQFSGNDYYTIQTPWLDHRLEKKVRSFGDFYCDFLYPPQWFKAELAKKPLASIAYRLLRKVAKARVRMHYYRFPFEKSLFKVATKHNSF